MDFGFALPQSGRLASPEALADAAQRAEDLGYATLWVLERLLRPVDPPAAPGGSAPRMPESYATVYDPIETLAYVAAHTSRIKLGTSIMVAPLHVPALLARRFATLDQLSGGRVIAGLGQGYAEEEFAAANVPLKRRGAGFEEFIHAMRAAWGPDPVRFAGRFYRIPESQIGPKPTQPGGPPLLIAARSLAAVERAARIGASWNLIVTDWEWFNHARRVYNEAVRAAGHDPSALRVVVRTNTTVHEKALPEPRTPLTGSSDQISADLARLRAMGVSEVFLRHEPVRRPARSTVSASGTVTDGGRVSTSEEAAPPHAGRRDRHVRYRSLTRSLSELDTTRRQSTTTGRAGSSTRRSVPYPGLQGQVAASCDV